MDEIIRLKDYGFENTEQNENEEEDEKAAEFNFKKNAAIGDIILLQAILCVIIVIALILANLIYIQAYDEFLEYFKNQVNKDFDYKDRILKLFALVADYFNAKI